MEEYTTYESAKKRLEEIAQKLEEKDISLETSLELYEEGAKLAAVCYDRLKSAELKFSQISLDKAEE